MLSDLEDAAVSRPMASIIIAAHNEAAVIGASLRSLVDGSDRALHIVVVPNGCTDNTAEVAAQYAGVQVVVEPTAGKAVALNSGDRAASEFPRIYLDADIVSTPGAVHALCAALDGPDVVVAVPSRRLNLAGRPLLVRAYFAIQTRLPVFERGLFGRGMIAMSQSGRARFGEFPIMIADDLFLDSLFTDAERVVVDGAVVTIQTPRRTRDLLRRLVRVRRGNQAMRKAAESGQVSGVVRASDRWSWLRDVVLPRPWLAPAGGVYALITVLAAVLARRGGRDLEWGRDESSRSPSTETEGSP